MLLLVRKDRWKSLHWTPYFQSWGKTLEIALLDEMLLVVGKDRWNSLCWRPCWYWWGKIAGNRCIERHNAIGVEKLLEFDLWFSKELTPWCGTLNAKLRQHPSELRDCRKLSYAWNQHICSDAYVIFKGTYTFMWCSERKMKSTSVWAEGLQNPLIRMKSTYLFSCTGDFQRKLQFPVVFYP